MPRVCLIPPLVSPWAWPSPETQPVVPQEACLQSRSHETLGVCPCQRRQQRPREGSDFPEATQLRGRVRMQTCPTRHPLRAVVQPRKRRWLEKPWTGPGDDPDVHWMSLVLHRKPASPSLPGTGRPQVGLVFPQGGEGLPRAEPLPWTLCHGGLPYPTAPGQPLPKSPFRGPESQGAASLPGLRGTDALPRLHEERGRHWAPGFTVHRVACSAGPSAARGALRLGVSRTGSCRGRGRGHGTPTVGTC